MEPSALSRLFYPGNTPTVPSQTRPNSTMPSIPSAKLTGNAPISADMKKLQELYEVLQAANTKLMRQIADLQDQLSMKTKECVIMLSDAELFAEAQQRPYFDEWFKKMLGTNNELDDLRAVEKEINKFRESIQKRLDAWKSEYKIFISLDQELRKESPKPSSVTEILAMMATEMDRDLQTIFRQIEETFKNMSMDLTEKQNELEIICGKMDEQTVMIKQLCQNLDLAKAALDNQDQWHKAYQELVESEKKAKQELKIVQSDLAQAKTELEESEAEVVKLKEEVIQQGCVLDCIKLEKNELQQRCKRAEDRVKILGEAEEERKYLFECLDKSQKSLADARSQVRLEAMKRSRVIEDAEEISSSFQESSLIESAKLKQEKMLRSEIALENESLRLKCASLEEQLRKEINADEICKRNAFMIKFIQTLDIESQLKFKEQFQKEFEA